MIRLFSLSVAQRTIWLLFAILGLTIMNSCVTNKKTTYLQEYSDSPYSGEYYPPDDYLIQPNDNLYVRVSTLDPRFSSFFNISSDNNNMRLDEQSADLMSYAVKLDGTVELPYVGSIEVAGLTLSEAKESIESVFTDYVSDAAITVKLINNYVSILGEISRPGLYPIYKERLNVFQALSLAGDLAIYSDRFQVSIVRQTLEGSVIKEFDITDKNIVDSEFYYIMPNDVIIVRPLKGKFFGMNQFPFAIVLSSITTFILVYNLIQSQ